MGLDAIKILGGAVIALAVYLGLIEQPRAKQTTINVTVNITLEDTMGVFGIDEILSGVLGSVLNTGGQIASQEMDFRNQKRLMEQQQEYYQQNARMQQGLALDTWEKTGYVAQRDQMERAGLNPGLMMSKGGGGGGTVQAPGGAMPSANAPPKFDAGMALQLGLNTALTQAQIENIKADSDKKRQDTKLSEAETGYKIALTGLTELDTGVRQLEQDILRAVKDANIQQALVTLEKLIVDTDTAKVQNRVLKGQADSMIESAKLAVASAKLENALTQAQIFKTSAEVGAIREYTKEATTRIWRMIDQHELDWKHWTLDEKDQAIREALKDQNQEIVDFQTSPASYGTQYIRALRETGELAIQLRAMKGKGKIGF